MDVADGQEVAISNYILMTSPDGVEGRLKGKHRD